MHVQSFELMILEQDSQCSLEKYDSAHEKRYIKLFLNFISTVVEFLHSLPIRRATEKIQAAVEEISKKGQKMKFVSIERCLVVVVI